MPEIAIDAKTCVRCGTCETHCSQYVLKRPGKDALPEVVRATFCISCGHCVAMCPRGAIRHASFPEGSVTPVRGEVMPSAESVLELLRARRSMRVFQDAPIERGAIETILEAVRMAPSAHNLQTTEYVVVQDRELMGKMTGRCQRFYAGLTKLLRNPLARGGYRVVMRREEVASVLEMLEDMEMVTELAGRGGDPFFHGAACLIVAHAQRNLNFPESNAVLGLHNAALAAQAMGLGGFLIGYLVAACQRDAGLRALLSLPRNHQVYGALALGHPKGSYPKWPTRRPLKVTWL